MNLPFSIEFLIYCGAVYIITITARHILNQWHEMGEG
jgi:hypothetical protein